MRLLLPILALAPALWPQEPAASPAPLFSDAEPPQRLTLQIGEHALQVTMGETFVMPDDAAGQECRLTPYPLRSLVLPGAVSFDYPDGAKFLGATFVPAFMWWDVVQNGELIALQRHVGSGDAAHQRNLYAENSLKCGGTDLGECTIALDGRVLTGRRVGGRSDHLFTQEIYSFEHAGATWLVLLHSEQPDPEPFEGLRIGADGGIVLIEAPGSAPATPSGSLRDRFLTSFRFL